MILVSFRHKNSNNFPTVRMLMGSWNIFDHIENELANDLCLPMIAQPTIII